MTITSTFTHFTRRIYKKEPEYHERLARLLWAFETSCRENGGTIKVRYYYRSTFVQIDAIDDDIAILLLKL